MDAKRSSEILDLALAALEALGWTEMAKAARRLATFSALEITDFWSIWQPALERFIHGEMAQDYVKGDAVMAVADLIQAACVFAANERHTPAVKPSVAAAQNARVTKAMAKIERWKHAVSQHT